MSQKIAVAIFITLSLVGAMLIIISTSLHFGKSLWHASEEASLQNFLTWTLKLSVFERTLLYSIGFICTFFLFIDTVFVIFILCTVKLENLPSFITSTYKKYNSDIECPVASSFNTPQQFSTPKTQAIAQKKEHQANNDDDKKVNKALFHYETEKSCPIPKEVDLMREIEKLKKVAAETESDNKSILLSSAEYDDTKFISIQIKDETQVVDIKLKAAGIKRDDIDIIIEEEEEQNMDDDTKDNKEIDQISLQNFPLGKYWSRLETLAEIHDVPDDLKPTQFIQLPNNAREIGLTDEMQQVLGHEINEILKTNMPDEEEGVDGATVAKQYVFIKPTVDFEEKSFEAIIYTGNREVCL